MVIDLFCRVQVPCQEYQVQSDLHLLDGIHVVKHNVRTHLNAFIKKCGKANGMEKSNFVSLNAYFIIFQYNAQLLSFGAIFTIINL